MEEVILEAKKRETMTKGQLKTLRGTGLIPAIVYGVAEKNTNVFINEKDVTKVLKSGLGANVLINLKFDGASKNVIIKEIQRHVISRKILHMDFNVISLKKEIEVNVPVKVTGEASGVKNQGGVLESILREVKLRCLPSDIPQSIAIDVSALNLGDHVSVKDLKLPPKVTAVSDPNAIVVHIVAPTKAEEVAPAAAIAGEAAPAEPEVISKGKKELSPEEAEEAAKAGGKPAEAKPAAGAKTPEKKPAAKAPSSPTPEKK
jgi:large subunit ribosomal protein L25